MHGTGNDFVVLDETRTRYGLAPKHYQWLAHRRFGVGADQILTVRAPSRPDVDFDYVIHNADGSLAGQCGNGARCLARFIHERQLSTKNPVWVQAAGRRLCLEVLSNHAVRVDMGVPCADFASIPFVPEQCTAPKEQLHNNSRLPQWCIAPYRFWTLSMGNPHAVILAEDVSGVALAEMGARLQSHAAFPASVNVGAMQIETRTTVRLRVYERGVGETLACGTGASAAVAAGILAGLLDEDVQVHMPGGLLRVHWPQTYAGPSSGTSLYLQGPATTVFATTVELPF